MSANFSPMLSPNRSCIVVVLCWGLLTDILEADCNSDQPIRTYVLQTALE